MHRCLFISHPTTNTLACGFALGFVARRRRRAWTGWRLHAGARRRLAGGGRHDGRLHAGLGRSEGAVLRALGRRAATCERRRAPLALRCSGALCRYGVPILVITLIVGRAFAALLRDADPAPRVAVELRDLADELMPERALHAYARSEAPMPARLWILKAYTRAAGDRRECREPSNLIHLVLRAHGAPARDRRTPLE